MAILPGGWTLLGQLLTGQSTDKFASIRLEDASNAAISTKPAVVSSAPEATGVVVTSQAEFLATDVTANAAYAVLVSDLGVDLGRDPINLPSGTAAIIRRKDSIGEVA